MYMNIKRLRKIGKLKMEYNPKLNSLDELYDKLYNLGLESTAAIIVNKINDNDFFLTLTLEFADIIIDLKSKLNKMERNFDHIKDEDISEIRFDIRYLNSKI